MIPRQDLELIQAISNNLHRLFAENDLATIWRRLDGWDPDGYPRPGPNRTGSGSHSDPTANHALKPHAPTNREIVRTAKPVMLAFETLLREACRPTHATRTEHITTDTPQPARPGAGTCQACGRQCQGTKNDRTITKHGPTWCKTHATGYTVARRTKPWLTPDAYTKQIRTQYGLDLDPDAAA